MWLSQKEREMTITVFVEQHPNEDMRTIHLSKPITLRPFTKYGTSGLPKKAMRLNNAVKPSMWGSLARRS